MYKTRKECRDETGLEPEDISKLATTSRASKRIKHQLEEFGSYEEFLEFVYQGMKAQHQRMLNKKQDTSEDKKDVSPSGHTTTHDDSTCACRLCEGIRRLRYMKARRTDPDTKSRYY